MNGALTVVVVILAAVLYCYSAMTTTDQDLLNLEVL